ncbi:uncharacterized protein [Parasteatoda tepidariorum]|uniref:uncharacterized protein n=1 Tax=Parasteatoda tepidariorum TaxID=114398 RepID=UPI00077FDEA1|nr:uncharacterized protein LOC107452463 [Parasteatoda tepidariorum]
MDKTICINRLYAWVLHNDMKAHNVSEKDVVKGIENMKKAYFHKNSNLSSDYVEAADFKSPAYRCAYLHKYAPIHTILVSDVTERVIDLQFNYFYDVIVNSGRVNVCSLGGGPGSDIVGIVLSLHNAFGPFQVYTNVIDCMPHWNSTLNSLIRETQQGSYGILKTCFSGQYFNWNYIGANLLDEFSEKVIQAISSADILNMVKFVSAAVCADTPSMIKRIFSSMKPGAMVFFLDNSVGDVKYLLTKIAEECELEPLYGPIGHERYINKLVQTNRFGYSSCYKTNIAIQVWIKPHRPVQDWYGSPIQAWTPFERTKQGSWQNQESFLNQSDSTPLNNKIRSAIGNPVQTSEVPFRDISKSLKFDDTDFNASDYEPENSFCSDEIHSNVFPNASPVHSGNFRERLISTPNFANSHLSTPTYANNPPLSHNFDNSYKSPIPFRNQKFNNSQTSPIPFRNRNCPNFEVKCNFQNSHRANRVVEPVYSSSGLDSGCWSASPSFNETDHFNNFSDVDYRGNMLPVNEHMQNNYSRTNNAGHPGSSFWNWYENRENIYPSSIENFQPKARTHYNYNNQRRYDPYKRR